MKVSDKKWDVSSQWLLMESKNPRAHPMPFCSLPRDVACVWPALIRGFLSWHQAVPFWIGDVTVGEKPELWRWLGCQDHLFNFSPAFHWTEGRPVCSGSLLFSPTTSYPSRQSTHPCLLLFSRLRTPVLAPEPAQGKREADTSCFLLPQLVEKLLLHCPVSPVP